MASIQAELVQRTGGNPFDNRDTVSSGGPDDAAVNRGVKRYAAEIDGAFADLIKWLDSSARPAHGEQLGAVR